MSFCKGCGSEVEDELTICPYCGTKIEKKSKQVNLVPSSQLPKNKKIKDEIEYDDRPVYTKNIKVLVILTLLTCGLFGILFWQPSISNDINKLTRKKDITGVQCFLFTILTCGWFHYFWHYKMGRKIQEIDYSKKDRGFIFLLSAIFGLWWINNIILQNAINSKAEYSN